MQRKWLYLLILALLAWPAGAQSVRLSVNLPANGATVERNFSLSGTATPGAQITVNGTLRSSGYADNSGNWTIPLNTQGLAKGTVLNLTVYASQNGQRSDQVSLRYAAGEGSATVGTSWVSVNAPTNGSTLTGPFNLSGTATPRQRIEVRGDLSGQGRSDGQGNWSIPLETPNLTAGQVFNLEVYSLDDAGNLSAPTNLRYAVGTGGATTPPFVGTYKGEAGSRSQTLVLSRDRNAQLTTAYRNGQPTIVQNGIWKSSGRQVTVDLATKNNARYNETIVFQANEGELVATQYNVNNWGRNGLVLNRTQEQPSGSSRKPVIDSLLVSPNRDLKVGETLTVVLTGTPGCQASFDILGSTSDVNLPEVSTGRYQTDLRLTNGMVVNEAVLVARLRRNGQETQKEASRNITVERAAGTRARITPTPADGGFASGYRPLIQATFEQPVQANRIRLWLDQNEVTGSSRLSSYEVSYQPNYDLSPGTHRARVIAHTTNGEQLDYNWSFQVGGSGQMPGGQQPYVSVSSPGSYGKVPQLFTLQGQATPGSTVDVQGTVTAAVIPGVIGVKTQKLQYTVYAQPNGTWQLPINFQGSNGSVMDLTLTARDNYGAVSNPVQVRYVLQR